jgi:transposase
MAAHDGTGERWRTRSLDDRKRIVVEDLAPGASVAAVARRHGLNANLVFKWIRRSREGWRDRRREPANEMPVVIVPPEEGAPAFVPVKLLGLDAPSAPPSDVSAKPARQTRRGARRGAMEISLPNGAKVSLDADVDAEALRSVGAGRRLMLQFAPGVKVYPACKPVDMRRGFDVLAADVAQRIERG